MPTNNERREVAAKLRKLAGVKWLDTFPHWEEAVMESWHSIRQLLDSRHINPDEDHEEICNRLADLIEPEPERTCRIEKRRGGWYCTECDELVGTVDTESEFFIDGNAIEMWKFCPYCGAKVIE